MENIKIKEDIEVIAVKSKIALKFLLAELAILLLIIIIYHNISSRFVFGCIVLITATIIFLILYLRQPKNIIIRNGKYLILSKRKYNRIPITQIVSVGGIRRYPHIALSALFVFAIETKTMGTIVFSFVSDREKVISRINELIQQSNEEEIGNPIKIEPKIM